MVNEMCLYTDPKTGFYTPYWKMYANFDKFEHLLLLLPAGNGRPPDVLLAVHHVIDQISYLAV